MAKTGRLKNLAAAAGVTAALAISGALSGAFNTAAYAGEPTEPSATVSVTTTQVSPERREELGKKMLGTLTALDNFLANSSNMPEEQFKKTGNQLLNAVAGMLDKGADPNYVDPQRKTSAFAWALWLSYELDRPDVVATFIAHGADVKQQVPSSMPIPKAELGALNTIRLGAEGINPDKISIADHAMRAVMESQIYYGKHLETAVDILKQLTDKGVQFGADTPSMASSQIQSYADLGRTILALQAMADRGLVSQAQIDKFVSITPVEREELRHIAAVDDKFVKNHGGKIADYPDSLPGGPEPYETKDGDTLRKIGQRFHMAMNAHDAAEAIEMIVAKNNLTGDQANPDAPLAKGTNLLLPTPVTHQIGFSQTIKADPLFGIASRIMQEIGASNIGEALENLRDANSLTPGMDLDTLLKPGSRIFYKVKGEAEPRSTTVQNDDALRGLAARVRPSTAINAPEDAVVKPGAATVEQVMEHLAEINGVSMDDVRAGAPAAKEALAPGKQVWVNFYNDNAEHLDQLVPPTTADPNRKITLYTIESKDYHGKRTLGVASHSNYAINHNADMSLFHSWDELLFTYPSPRASQALRMMFNLHGLDLQDRVVFSLSMAHAQDYRDMDKARQMRRGDEVEFESVRRMLDHLEAQKPIIFGAAGNFRQDVNGQGEGDERYVQSYLAMHSPRAVNVGAVGTYEGVTPSGKDTISFYSSYAGDVCASLPRFMQDQMEGTSFATPDLAGIDRQMLEWYGNKLSFEEIMAAGLMVGNRDLMDFDPTGGQLVKEGNDLHSVPALWRTNGAGVPIHERCGTGNIDRHTAVLWNETLKRMVELKGSQPKDQNYRSFKLGTGKPAITLNSDGTKTYTYRIKAPIAMTLDKLTFLVPQERRHHSEVFVKSPAGFEVQLPKSPYDVVSSRAFVYEDVKAGDVIEIRTSEPLAAHAGMYLRGQADGNIIQQIREELRADGVLYAPLKNMIGDKVVTDEEAAKARAARKVLPKSAKEELNLPAPSALPGQDKPNPDGGKKGPAPMPGQDKIEAPIPKMK